MRKLLTWLFTIFVISGCKPSEKVEPVDNVKQEQERAATEKAEKELEAQQAEADSIRHSVQVSAHIEEAKQRVVDHYNSAEEVAYRKDLEIKEHFNHLRRMNAIENGASDVETELIKSRQEEEIRAMETAHAITERDWQHSEDQWDADWMKSHQ